MFSRWHHPLPLSRQGALRTLADRKNRKPKRYHAPLERITLDLYWKCSGIKMSVIKQSWVRSTSDRDLAFPGSVHPGHLSGMPTTRQMTRSIGDLAAKTAFENVNTPQPGGILSHIATSRECGRDLSALPSISGCPMKRDVKDNPVPLRDRVHLSCLRQPFLDIATLRARRPLVGFGRRGAPGTRRRRCRWRLVPKRLQ